MNDKYKSLKKLRVKQLKELCKKHNLRGFSKCKNKNDLIEFLKKHKVYDNQSIIEDKKEIIEIKKEKLEKTKLKNNIKIEKKIHENIEMPNDIPIIPLPPIEKEKSIKEEKPIEKVKIEDILDIVNPSNEPSREELEKEFQEKYEKELEKQKKILEEKIKKNLEKEKINKEKNEINLEDEDFIITINNLIEKIYN